MPDFNPDKPLNPNDLDYWQIDVKFLLEELSQRLADLQSDCVHQNGWNDMTKGIHQGQITELESIIKRIQANITRPERPNLGPGTADDINEDNDDGDQY